MDAEMSPARVVLDTVDGSGNQRMQSADTGYLLNLQGAFSPVKGLGVFAAGGASDTGTVNEYGNSSFAGEEISSNFDAQHLEDALASADLRLTVYPGAWYDGAFVPGRTANADGWLLWPSFSMAYRYENVSIGDAIDESSSIYSFDWFFGSVYTHGVGNYNYSFGVMNQFLSYALTLPLTPFLTAQAGYARNLESVDTNEQTHVATSAYGTQESVDLDLNAYINLVAGAGADTKRAFLPGFGRRGQLAVSVGWERTWVMATDHFEQVGDLWLGGAVSDNLGLRLGMAVAVSGSPPWDTTGLGVVARDDDAYTYIASMSWAFGNPAGREDRL